MVNRLRQLIRNYFAFSKVQTNGFIVLVPLMIIVLFLPGIYVNVFSKEYNPYEEDIKMMDSLMAAWDEVIVLEPEVSDAAPDLKIELKPFNPNEANISELQALGIPVFLTKRIDNYRNKGGQFRIKTDLSRIYDFPDSLYKVLETYIELPDKIERKKSFEVRKRESRRDSVSRKPDSAYVKRGKVQPKLWIDLSTADTTELMRLRGIGPSFSKRIIKYRNLLGGFVTKDQLKEVYGLSDSLYNSLQDQLYVGQMDSVATININIANYDALKKHPYISYKLAREILKSRSKIGKFRSLHDLMVVEGVDSVSASRLRPYITY
ncbi:MAG: helix-hairpin-helix domain-containing protein [Roseivirga sp.]